MALVLTLINIFYNFAIICVVIGVTSGLYRYRPCYYSYGKSWVILTWSILIQHVTHRSMLICSQYYISDYGATTWLCGKLGNTCILSYSHFLPTSINWLLEPHVCILEFTCIISVGLLHMLHNYVPSAMLCRYTYWTMDGRIWPRNCGLTLVPAGCNLQTTQP